MPYPFPLEEDSGFLFVSLTLRAAPNYQVLPQAAPPHSAQPSHAQIRRLQAVTPSLGQKVTILTHSGLSTVD